MEKELNGVAEVHTYLIYNYANHSNWKQLVQQKFSNLNFSCFCPGMAGLQYNTSARIFAFGSW